MAKKNDRPIIALACEVCKNKNYTDYKNRLVQEKLEVRKYCAHCKKHTVHKETKLK